jgi:hypothetical protein
MEKSPILTKPEIEEKEKHQSKHKKSETLCKDKRRSYFNCGICGSEDIVEQGVGYCSKCNAEVMFFETKRWFPKWPKICDCKLKYKEINKYKIYLSVRKCVTCGATEAKTCPACKENCWTSTTGEKYCKRCGYRS